MKTETSTDNLAEEDMEGYTDSYFNSAVRMGIHLDVKKGTLHLDVPEQWSRKNFGKIANAIKQTIIQQLASGKNVLVIPLVKKVRYGVNDLTGDNAAILVEELKDFEFKDIEIVTTIVKGEKYDSIKNFVIQHAGHSNTGQKSVTSDDEMDSIIGKKTA